MRKFIALSLATAIVLSAGVAVRSAHRHPRRAQSSWRPRGCPVRKRCRGARRLARALPTSQSPGARSAGTSRSAGSASHLPLTSTGAALARQARSSSRSVRPTASRVAPPLLPPLRRRSSPTRAGSTSMSTPSGSRTARSEATHKTLMIEARPPRSRLKARRNAGLLCLGSSPRKVTAMRVRACPDGT